ncbi:MAG: hypothetical protein Q8Q10_04060 [bacterium]|nr:hypothetical protein [bacterium]
MFRQSVGFKALWSILGRLYAAVFRVDEEVIARAAKADWLDRVFSAMKKKG